MRSPGLREIEDIKILKRNLLLGDEDGNAKHFPGGNDNELHPKVFGKLVDILRGSKKLCCCCPWEKPGKESEKQKREAKKGASLSCHK
jgi:hypothetical protein